MFTTFTKYRLHLLNIDDIYQTSTTFTKRPTTLMKHRPALTMFTVIDNNIYNFKC